MKIRTVTYRATVTPSEYQGGSTMTRSMEATAELEEGVCPDYELGKLVDYVHEALAELRRGYAQDSPGQGPHPCHYAGYTCRRPAKFRLYLGHGLRFALAGMQMKLSTAGTWACDECWERWHRDLETEYKREG